MILQILFDGKIVFCFFFEWGDGVSILCCL